MAHHTHDYACLQDVTCCSTECFNNRGQPHYIHEIGGPDDSNNGTSVRSDHENIFDVLDTKVHRPSPVGKKNQQNVEGDLEDQEVEA
jgi:hypothetical protein